MRAQPALPAPQPDERRHARRRAMRVLLTDELDRLLLFRDSDPGLDPVPRFWITPGGGVDPGESDEQAAVREIWEETGLTVDEGELVGPLATRTVQHGYSDVVTTQDEVFWLVRCSAFEVSTTGHTEEELTTMDGHRWWTRQELEGTTEDIWPRNLVELWERSLAAAADDDGGAVQDLGLVDESTVRPPPVGP